MSQNNKNSKLIGPGFELQHLFEFINWRSNIARCPFLSPYVHILKNNKSKNTRATKKQRAVLGGVPPPASSMSFTVSSLPALAIQCNGVSPFEFLMFTFAPFCINNWATFLSPQVLLCFTLISKKLDRFLVLVVRVNCSICLNCLRD